MDSNPTLEDGELAAAVWDLRPIVDATGDEGASALITRARRAAQFSDSYAGQLAGLPAADFAIAVSEMAAIRELVNRFQAYAGLRGAVDGADPSVGQLRGATETAAAEIAAALLFLSWSGSPSRTPQLRPCSPKPATGSTLPPITCAAGVLAGPIYLAWINRAAAVVTSESEA